jgi:hypothetical protein
MVATKFRWKEMVTVAALLGKDILGDLEHTVADLTGLLEILSSMQEVVVAVPDQLANLWQILTR